MSKLHKQVPAKVTIFVDEGVKELVEVLSTFENVETVESCQCNEDGLAYVDLVGVKSGRYDYRTTNTFAHKLAKALMKRIEMKRIKNAEEPESTEYEIELILHWTEDKRRILLSIRLPPNMVAAATNVFSLLRSEI